MSSSRYDRQIILKEFGPKAQDKLASARVLVVGAGGLGIPVLHYLNAMGVGHLGIVDGDRVQESNLHRQVIYTEKQVGDYKVAAAKYFLQNQNSQTIIDTFCEFLNEKNAIDDACVILKKPFVYGALYGFEGQLSVFNYNEGPTYRCVFPTPPKADEIPNCDTQGVLGILPGIVGNLQALETVKLIAGIGIPLSGKLLIFDALEQQYHQFHIQKKHENSQIYTLQKSYAIACAEPIHTINAEAFLKLHQQEALQIIDIREPDEVKNAPFTGALNIPFQHLSDNIKGEPLGTVVYFLCQSGVRSARAIQQLQEHYPNTKFISVEGGIKALLTYEY
ncbi:MAG: sulfurtransferase [Flavobacteriia bacterium]|nr:sulfurtransferase [Flavobacteriia bacterium]